MAPPRDTLVIEMLVDDRVARDGTGRGSLESFLRSLETLFGATLERQPVICLSPRCGLSGWAVFAGGAAAHLYAWDDRRPCFLSADLLVPADVDRAAAVRHTTGFFGAAGDAVAVKAFDDPAPAGWRDLAPGITRQRLRVWGTPAAPVGAEMVGKYFPALSEALGMNSLETHVHGRHAWMHWEESGVLVDWNGEVTAEIYSCRPFDPADAVAVTRERLGLEGVRFRAF